MKTKIWIITAVSLIFAGGIIFAGAMNMLKWDFKGINTTKYETNTYDIEDQFEGITIKTNTADISFLKSNDETCRVECLEPQKAKHTVFIEQNKLNIDITDMRKWYDHISFFSFDTPKITVYLPYDKYASLVINSSTGEIEIPNNFTFDSIDIKASTGNVNCKASTVNHLKIKLSTGHINAEDITAGNINFTTSTGGINIRSVDCSGEFKVNVTTGKCYLTNVNCENFVSNGDTGDMALTNVIATKDFNIERSTGDIKLEKCDADKLFIETDTGDVKGSLLTSKVFICETDTGRVNVPKSTEGGRCEISTDTGDIKIETGK